MMMMIMIMIMIMIMHDADADVMIIAKRWTDELTFSFVTQDAMSWRTELCKAMRSTSFSAGSHRLLCATVTATSLII